MELAPKPERSATYKVAVGCGVTTAIGTVIFFVRLIDVKARHEHSGGLGVVLDHLIVFGPIALIGLIASLASKRAQPKYLLLNLTYVLGWGILAVLDSSAPRRSNEEVNAEIAKVRRLRDEMAAAGDTNRVSQLPTAAATK